MPRVARLLDRRIFHWKFVNPDYHSDQYFEVCTDSETIERALDDGIGGGDGSMLIREEISIHYQPWWFILELPWNSTAEEIKKAFRKQSLMHHPDHGGDEEMFKVINAAYQKALSKKERSPSLPKAWVLS